jgi:hypothetical protein
MIDLNLNFEKNKCYSIDVYTRSSHMNFETQLQFEDARNKAAAVYCVT